MLLHTGLASKTLSATFRSCIPIPVFFRDKKGDMDNTATVLVTRDRKSIGIAAHVVPGRG